MSRDVIQMDYAWMQTTAQKFKARGDQMEGLIKDALRMAAAMDDGVLQGEAGDAFAEAIRQRLVPAMTRLKDKFGELASDVIKAQQEMAERDGSSSQAF